MARQQGVDTGILDRHCQSVRKLPLSARSSLFRALSFLADENVIFPLLFGTFQL